MRYDSIPALTLALLYARRYGATYSVLGQEPYRLCSYTLAKISSGARLSESTERKYMKALTSYLLLKKDEFLRLAMRNEVRTIEFMFECIHCRFWAVPHADR